MTQPIHALTQSSLSNEEALTYLYQIDETSKQLAGSPFSEQVLSLYTIFCNGTTTTAAEDPDWAKHHFTEHPNERIRSVAAISHSMFLLAIQKIKAQEKQIKELQVKLHSISQQNEINKARVREFENPGRIGPICRFPCI